MKLGGLGLGCCMAVLGFYCRKAAVHWERPGHALAQSSPNLTWAAIWGCALTQRVIASHVKFGDDSALNALTRGQWTAAFTGGFRKRLGFPSPEKTRFF